jgi:hypothetical protein
MGLIGCLSLMILMASGVKRQEQVNKITTYSLRSLDILRPYFGEEKYIKMLSDYYQISNASQFYLFNNKIMHDANIYGVKLPEFKPL